MNTIGGQTIVFGDKSLQGMYSEQRICILAVMSLL
jgi:hypothetical protein